MQPKPGATKLGRARRLRRSPHNVVVDKRDRLRPILTETFPAEIPFIIDERRMYR